jgi:hypothetical protein
LAAAQFNSAQIALEAQRKREAAMRAWTKKQQEEAEVAAQEALNQEFQAKLSEAQGVGLSLRESNNYIDMAKSTGYASAITALDAFITNAKHDAEETRKFQEAMKEKEAREAAEKAKREAEEKAAEEKKKQQSVTKECNQTQVLAGAVITILVDLFVGLPAAWLVISGAGVTPAAMAGEAIELLVVLPVTILGIYLVIDSGCV